MARRKGRAMTLVDLLIVVLIVVLVLSVAGRIR